MSKQRVHEHRVREHEFARLKHQQTRELRMEDRWLRARGSATRRRIGRLSLVDATARASLLLVESERTERGAHESLHERVERLASPVSGELTEQATGAQQAEHERLAQVVEEWGDRAALVRGARVHDREQPPSRARRVAQTALLEAHVPEAPGRHREQHLLRVHGRQRRVQQHEEATHEPVRDGVLAD